MLLLFRLESLANVLALAEVDNCLRQRIGFRQPQCEGNLNQLCLYAGLESGVHSLGLSFFHGGIVAHLRMCVKSCSHFLTFLTANSCSISEGWVYCKTYCKTREMQKGCQNA